MDEVVEFPLKITRKKKKKHKQKEEVPGCSLFPALPNDDKTAIGVPLKTALERYPCHDGVPLPSFVRHLIDFVEQYGLAIEGIYRVPGVDSQLKQLINALNNGIEFPEISPTSPAFINDEEALSRTARARGKDGQTAFERISHLSPLPRGEESSTNSMNMSPLHFALTPLPPHDPSVVTSLIKHFLRSLPEPVLTTELAGPIEEILDLVPDDISQRRCLAKLVHTLPRPNQYLLAWLLQHMTRVIDRAGDNQMTLANLVIVFSPILQMSHRLLAFLLSEPREGGGVIFDEKTESANTRLVGAANVSSRLPPHWLFPHSAFVYRPYIPPIPPTLSLATGGISFDIPDSLPELEDELFKQESLLDFTHRQIASGKANTEKDAFIWEVQHMVTKMKRKKALLELTDPEAIRSELARHEARLDHVEQEITKAGRCDGSAIPLSTASPEKVTKPVNPRLPVSQLDVLSPTTAKKRSNPRTVKPQSPTEPNSLDAEFWELQQIVTMLRRRLKLQPKSTLPIQQSSSEPVITDSLDTEEVLDFSLRKPPSVDRSVPLPLNQVAKASESCHRSAISEEVKLTHLKEASGASGEEEMEVVIPKVESFPVEWPTTPTPQQRTGAEGMKPRKSQEFVTAVNATESETKLELLDCCGSLDPASQYLLLVYNYWVVRQQELMACQHDLKSRIRSQQAEISRIKMCISQMIGTSEVTERRVRQYFEENEHLISVTHPTSSSQSAAIVSNQPTAFNSSDDEDDDNDDGDEGEMASTLLLLVRDNARLEALNKSYIEKIIAERDSCAHLKVQLRLNTCMPPPLLLPTPP